MQKSIRIPVISSSERQGLDEIQEDGECIEMFPDEIPLDHNDLIDVLRSELAPFRVWRTCAVEYRRQGRDEEFNQVLNEIVGALGNPDVEKIYCSRDDYKEGITEIFLALAAKALVDLIRSRRTESIKDKHAILSQQVVEYLRLADEKLRINEYTWLIKGFYENAQGDYKRADDHFKSVYDRASKGSNVFKKKFLFASQVGLGVVAFNRGNLPQALDYLSKAVCTNPSCDASLRLAVSVCCFKLEQFDRAKVAADRALSLEVHSLHCSIVPINYIVVFNLSSPSILSLHCFFVPVHLFILLYILCSLFIHFYCFPSYIYYSYIILCSLFIYLL